MLVPLRTGSCVDEQIAAAHRCACCLLVLLSITQAANALLKTGGPLDTKASKQKLHQVLAVREDEPQVKLGQQLNAQFMGALSPLGLDSPWVR